MSYGVSCMGPVLLLMLTACAVERPRYGSNVPSRFSEVLAWLMGPKEFLWRSGGGLVVKCVASVSEFEYLNTDILAGIKIEGAMVNIAKMRLIAM